MSHQSLFIRLGQHSLSAEFVGQIVPHFVTNQVSDLRYLLAALDFRSKGYTLLLCEDSIETLFLSQEDDVYVLTKSNSLEPCRVVSTGPKDLPEGAFRVQVVNLLRSRHDEVDIIAVPEGDVVRLPDLDYILSPRRRRGEGRGQDDRGSRGGHRSR